MKEFIKMVCKLTGVCHPVWWGMRLTGKVKYNRSSKTYTRDVLGHKMHLNGRDSGLSLSLVKDGIREPESVIILKHYLKPDMNILEIGANIGFYVLMEAEVIKKGNGSILALEPGPSNIELLKLNVAENNYEDKVKIISGAVAQKSGTGELAMSELCNCHQLLELSKNSSAQNTIKVDTYSLKDLLKEANWDFNQVDLLRMDIEGAEYMVLPSIIEDLRSCDSILMFIEFHPDPKYNEEHTNFLKELEQSGFKCLGVTKEYPSNGRIRRQPFLNATIHDLYTDPLLLASGGCEVFLGKGY